MSESILNILESLVVCDTQNPPRIIAPTHPIFDEIKKHLPNDFQFVATDFDDGRVNLLAKRGNPKLLFNVHLDTVPGGEGWTHNPLQLTRDGERVIGRGVCDIKGAAACLIEAARSTDTQDIAVLFSTDEEGSNSCCIDQFCQSELAKPFQRVVVAEPTECRAVVGHRGYLSFRMEFTGQAAHTSQHHLLSQSANHKAANWITKALHKVERFEAEKLDGASACFNVGRIDGGIKNNMIADQCTVTWSGRMPGGYPNELLLNLLAGEALPLMGHDPPIHNLKGEVTFDGASFPRSVEDRNNATAWCQQHNLPQHEDVDFWTEAAIFSTHGKPTIVLGPGNIAQAHTPDEWLAIEQLATCTDTYRRLMESHSGK